MFHYCAFNKVVYLYWDISMPTQDITDTDVLLQVATPKQLLNNRSLSVHNFAVQFNEPETSGIWQNHNVFMPKMRFQN